MIELSASTRRHVATLFASRDVEAAEDLLVTACGDNVPLLGVPQTPAGLERVRFAALRTSGGRLGRLHDAVRLAQTHWRDLLVAAGFAEDPHAHEQWEPRRLDAQTIDHWMADELPAEVNFRLNDSVEVLVGPLCGNRGAVITLVALDPEPRYVVELATGEDIEVDQRALGALDNSGLHQTGPSRRSGPASEP